jgi:hypothetical protein
MGPFQPGEQVWAVIVDDTPTYDLDENDQPINRRMALTVYAAPATVLYGGKSGQLSDGRQFHFREGFVFRDDEQALNAAQDITERINAGEPPPPR